MKKFFGFGIFVFFSLAFCADLTWVTDRGSAKSDRKFLDQPAENSWNEHLSQSESHWEQFEREQQQQWLKFKEDVVAVVGVPPFQDESLAKQTDLSKWACPEIIEDLLLVQEGVFPVEIAEAYAIGQELDRAGRRAG